MRAPTLWRQVAWQSRRVRWVRKVSSPLRPSRTASVAPLPVVSHPPEAQESRLLAPMPGILTRYIVEEGQRVEEGQVVAFLEAMKMENALPSPKRGVVHLTARVGQKVQRGDILAIIE